MALRNENSGLGGDVGMTRLFLERLDLVAFALRRMK